MSKGCLVIISSPSGGGKGTVINEMRKIRPDLRYSVSMTTREPRPTEKDGEHYFFITRERFQEMENAGLFLESSPYSAMGNLYGTPREYVEAAIAEGRDILLEIEINGMRQVKQKMPEAVTVFLMPPTLEDWENQLKNRNDNISEEERNARLETGREEIGNSGEYDYVVTNLPGNPSHAATEILEIIDRHKRELNP